MNRTHLATRVVHSGEPRIQGSGVIPIFRSTIWEHQPEEAYHDIRYPRLSNLPNHVALADKIAALENADAGLVTGSGMAAITTSLLTLLGPGDHLLVQECLYGGTHSLVTNDLAALGIEHDFVNGDDQTDWESRVRPTTRAFYVESIANPLLTVSDHEAVATFAKEHSLVAVIDSTFASPVNFRPLDWGFDLVLHSATKYLNGHSDVVAGVVAGEGRTIERIKHRLDHFGGVLDPHACYLLNRGIKTLVLRVDYQNVSSLEIARFLEAHSRVRSVHYPGLQSHPQHTRAQRLFTGFGGMLSFELEGGGDAAQRLLNRVEIPMASASLGGVETVITCPAATTHSTLAAADRERLGIGDGLLRLSVGIESTDDLIRDLERALE